LKYFTADPQLRVPRYTVISELECVTVYTTVYNIIGDPVKLKAAEFISFSLLPKNPDNIRILQFFQT